VNICEEEFEDMLKVTTADLRKLLDDTSETPVLYVARDVDPGEPVRLEVWDDAYVPYADVVVRRHELKDAAGAVDKDDDLDDLLPGYQGVVEEILQR
jgi:hypothetical protein